MNKCQTCNKEIVNSKKFCSIKCSNKSRTSLDYSDCKTEKEKRAKYWRHYYSQNKQKHVQRVQNRKNKIIRDSKKKLKELKSKLQCSECGENHIATLDFHHTNKDLKLSTVSSLVCNGYSWESILLEIQKCIVLCSNCHRKLHYNERI